MKWASPRRLKTVRVVDIDLRDGTRHNQAQDRIAG
jgi:hypothetical protein